MEYRAFRAESIGENDEGKLQGLVAPFSRETIIGDPDKGGFREQIAPGAFKKTIREGDIVLLDNHDMTRPLARTTAGTLTLREEGDGLHFDATPADTTYGRDLRVNVKAGNIRGMSFGFHPVKDEWFKDGKPSNRFEGTHRVLREVRAIEVSAVTRPAYDDTSIFARDELLSAREARAGKKPYGNVKYADQKNGKYPVNTKKRIRAAWAYISKPKNAAVYPLNGVTLASVKAAIRAAAKKAGVKISNRALADFDLSGYCPRHGFAECEVRCDGAVGYETRIKKLPTGTAKRVVQMNAELKQALALIQAAGVDNLPQQVQDAVALVSAAKVHSGHVIKQQKIKKSVVTRAKRKPETSTSDEQVMDALVMQELASRADDEQFEA